MAKRKCPFFSARKGGRWLKYSCSSPGPCPDTGCQANPCFKEADSDGDPE